MSIAEQVKDLERHREDLLANNNRLHEQLDAQQARIAALETQLAAKAELINTLKTKRDDAYCDYISQLRTPDCLGWAAKVKSGSFGGAEMAAHKKANEFLGKHLAYNDAIDLMVKAIEGEQHKAEQAKPAQKITPELLAEVISKAAADPVASGLSPAEQKPGTSDAVEILKRRRGNDPQRQANVDAAIAEAKAEEDAAAKFGGPHDEAAVKWAKERGYRVVGWRMVAVGDQYIANSFREHDASYPWTVIDGADAYIPDTPRYILAPEAAKVYTLAALASEISKLTNGTRAGAFLANAIDAHMRTLIQEGQQ